MRPLFSLLALYLFATARANDVDIENDDGNIVLRPAESRSVIVNGDLYVNGSKVATEADMSRLAALEGRATTLVALVESCSCNTSNSTTTSVDNCMSSPCSNGGVCTSDAGGFLCMCASGFTGIRCQTNVDECASSPCVNGGSCSEEPDSFMCTCADGFDGIVCEQHITPTPSPSAESFTCPTGTVWIGDMGVADRRLYFATWTNAERYAVCSCNDVICAQCLHSCPSSSCPGGGGTRNACANNNQAKPDPYVACDLPYPENLCV